MPPSPTPISNRTQRRAAERAAKKAPLGASRPVQIPVDFHVQITRFVQDGQIRVHYEVKNQVGGLTNHDVGKVLLKLASDMLLGVPVRLATVTEQMTLQKAQETLQKYPAVEQWPERAPSGAFLCAACIDLYEDLLEGPHYPMPPGGAVPCSFHMDGFESAPLPLEEALARRAAIDDPGPEAHTAV